MNCAPTLTREEFKVLHNTLWELGNIQDSRVQELVERIRSVALKGAYEQDSTAFERQHEHYSKVREELGLRAIWSVYEVEDLHSAHPYPGSSFVIYKDHWGEKPIHAAVWGPTWADIYKAADACIQGSGDDHHVFIEGFEVKNYNELHMITGS